jgi:hypothetical protein
MVRGGKAIPASSRRKPKRRDPDESPRRERQGTPYWLIVVGLVAVGKLVYEAWRWTRLVP